MRHSPSRSIPNLLSDNSLETGNGCSSATSVLFRGYDLACLAFSPVFPHVITSSFPQEAFCDFLDRNILSKDPACCSAMKFIDLLLIPNKYLRMILPQDVEQSVVSDHELLGFIVLKYLVVLLHSIRISSRQISHQIFVKFLFHFSGQVASDSRAAADLSRITKLLSVT